MFRSPLGRKLSARVRAARRVVLVVSLFAAVAALPHVNAGAWQQEQETRSSTKSQPSVKGQANIIEGAEFVPGEVLVRFRSDAAAKSAEASAMSLLGDEIGGEVSLERFDGSETVRGLRLARVDPANTLEAVAELAARSDVLYAEPNYIWRAKRTPNDPFYTNGQMYGLNQIGAPAAWNTTTGSKSVVVGVLDGGVDISHDDLEANLWTNTAEVAGNGLDDDGNGFADDIHGWDFHHNDSSIFDNEDGDDHATHVAGTIGAQGDNNLGVVGVNWQVSIVSIKVLGPDGGATSRIINGYNYARKLREAGVNLRVLNNSYGGPGKSLAALDAINQLNNVGILFVVAAGNGGFDNIGDDNFSFPDFPSNYDAPNVLAVSATNSSDNITGFSNFSSRLVSMGAPGQSILSTTPNNTYSFISGTSMASPHVAGAAALVCAANPNISAAQLRGVLAYTGDRLFALESKTTTGRRLNVANAVASALEHDTTAPATPGNFRITGQNGRSVTLAWTAPGDNGSAGAAADYDFFFIHPTTQVKTLLPTTLIPAAAGTQQSVAVNVPFLNFNGTIQIRAYDDTGNASNASVAVTIPVNPGSDPYTVALSGAQPVTPMTGTSLLNGDDVYLSNHQLPFAFPFYGVNRTSLTISTNGTLYFSTPPRRANGDASDAQSTIEALQGQTMIAGLWDDIDMRTCMRSDSGVYIAFSDASRTVIRWQGVLFSQDNCPATPNVGNHINFEVELRNDGTIQFRYGNNPRVFPVVGISGGEPDAYVVASHTNTSQSLNLSGAQTVTFAPRVAQLFSIAGSVKDANGVGVPNINVTIEGGMSVMTSTDANGNYAFNNLKAEVGYTVRAFHPNYSVAPTSIVIPSLTSNQTANFTANLNSQTGANTVGFSQAAYQYGEGAGRATVTVTRAGDTSGAITVNYRTADSDTFTVGCSDTTGNQGGAYARCDFATTVGSLSFAAGELSKTIIVPLIDDAHVESSETFQLQLSNATGTSTTLGAQAIATLTIQDNDTAGGQNPVTTSIPFFVRQQYLDFLSREPEAGEPWSAVMARCPSIFTGPEVTNTDCDRIAVSRAFFESPEFQLKGFYVFRFYKLAYNRLPLYTEIVSDMSFVAGATEAEVYTRRAQLAVDFTTRHDFLNAYGMMTNTQFVSALLGRYGLNSVTTPDPATPDSGTRVTFTGTTLANRLDANSLTRAQVFRAVADSDQVQAAEFNSAFVAVQYYGYLRRTPEPAGYQDNLNALQRGVSPREMVNAFLNSAEYRLRFGQP